MILRITLSAILFITLLQNALAAREAPNKTERSRGRKGKLFSVFQLVRFPNDPCGASSGRNGTCYTEKQCEEREGTASGTCAEGYGVCCTFSIGCGQQTNENCTHFELGTGGLPASGSCAATVCKCNENICKLRLDFETFTIAGPSAADASVATTTNGLVTPGAGKKVALASRCLTDTFTVSNPGGNSPPVICGTNTGQHMYVDASDDCNELNFGIMGGAAGASWNIKVTQISCDSELCPPDGCTKYFYGNGGEGMGVSTYNFGGGRHLANQDERICFRREIGQCKICWYATADTDVALSGKKDGGSTFSNAAVCGNYGTDGMATMYDHIIVQGAMTKQAGQAKSMTAIASRFCGRSKGLLVAGGTKTICSTSMPFLLRFKSDAFEFAEGGDMSEAKTANTGFNINYFQNNDNC